MLLDKFGRILYSDTLQDGVDLGDRSLRGAIFKGAALHGLELSGSDLRGSDFTDCNLYWLDLFNANCNDCLFNGAVLEGANLKSACFRNADFSGATICADRLGKASSLAHADLTGAKLANAVLEGTEYDVMTIFPADFDPKKHGMLLVQVVDDWLLVPECG
jgi:uncharacterized protein YjbI with pentapeptide repeats